MPANRAARKTSALTLWERWWLSNSAMQAIGCVAARMCHTNNCPASIATPKEALRKRLDVNTSAQKLATFIQASTELMQVMARLAGVQYAGYAPLG